MTDWPWPQYGTCNCACRTCLAGSCCMFSSPGHGFTTTTTTTNTAHEHRWVAVGLHKGDVIQSCDCGDVRRASPA